MPTEFQTRLTSLYQKVQTTSGQLTAVENFLISDGGADAVNAYIDALKLEINNLSSSTKKLAAQSLLSAAGVEVTLTASDITGDIPGSQISGSVASANAAENLTGSVAGSQVTGSVASANAAENLTGSVAGSQVTGSVASANSAENVTGSVAGSQVTGSVANAEYAVQVTGSVAGSQVDGSVTSANSAENLTGSVAASQITGTVANAEYAAQVTGSVAGSQVDGDLPNASINSDNVRVSASNYLTDNRGFLLEEMSITSLLEVLQAKLGELDSVYIKRADGVMYGHETINNLFIIADMLQELETKIGYHEDVTYPLSGFIANLVATQIRFLEDITVNPSSYLTDNRGFQISEMNALTLAEVMQAKIGELDSVYIKRADGVMYGHETLNNLFIVADMLQELEIKLGYHAGVTYPLSDFVANLAENQAGPINASQIVGSIPGSQIDGAVASADTCGSAASANTCTTAANLVGTINGSQITGSVAGSQISGSVASADTCGSAASANTCTTAANLVGTIDGSQITGLVAGSQISGSVTSADTCGTASNLSGSIDASQVTGSIPASQIDGDLAVISPTLANAMPTSEIFKVTIHNAQDSEANYSCGILPSATSTIPAVATPEAMDYITAATLCDMLPYQTSNGVDMNNDIMNHYYSFLRQDDAYCVDIMGMDVASAVALCKYLLIHQIPV